MDIPSRQAQETFTFDFNEFSHTAIYGSAGFGKSVALQTFVMNLVRKNTPEQLHVYLFDFGTNGLLPLKDLPHVADLVHLEENEKLVKCVKKIRQELTKRKDEFFYMVFLVFLNTNQNLATLYQLKSLY
nr:FtsK/SpoIIIE domain-containing protein [Enterococcus durans]